MPRQLAARGPTITKKNKVLEVTHQSVSPTHHPTVSRHTQNPKFDPTFVSGENFPMLAIPGFKDQLILGGRTYTLDLSR